MQLQDGIFPNWPVFLKTMSSPITGDQRRFCKMQEAIRKDVERAFGILQARFAIVSRPARFWKSGTLAKVLKCSIILHNLIVEDERDSYFSRTTTVYSYTCGKKGGRDAMMAELARVNLSRFNSSDNDSELTPLQKFIGRFKAIQNEESHFQLRDDIIEHLAKSNHVL